MKKITTLVLLCFLASCNTVSTYYQVYKTKSETVKPTGNSIAFDDSNCRVTYNLWSENGNPGFTFYNKTNEVIYIQLDESFYVINDKAYDYYQNRIYTNSSNSALVTTKSSGFSAFGKLSLLSSYASNTIASNSSNGVETIEAKVVAIPPKTNKNISEFNVNKTIIRDCDLLRFPTSKQTSSKAFSEDTSPLRFYNIITYKLGDKINKVKNDFYVSEVTNIAENDAFKEEKNAFCNQKGGGITNVFMYSGPDKFYLTYTKKQTDTWKY